MSYDPLDDDPALGALVHAACNAAADVPAALAFAAQYGAALPTPGSGDTLARWRMLAATAWADLTVARTLEPHVDALAILDEAGVAPRPGRYGVFAAEAPDVSLAATLENGRWQLTGTKPWCSLADRLERALVTAHVPDGRRLFDVNLRQPGVRAAPSEWVARGLRDVTSGPVHFAESAADPVGDTDWYLTRPGFAWGGIGVAACWYGAALALAGTLRNALAVRGADPIRQLNLGIVDVALHAAWACLADAASQIDSGRAFGARGVLLAGRVRAIGAAAAERTIEQVGHALGPAPLAFEETYARRVADLELYLRQHHAERDIAAVGAQVVREHLDEAAR